MTAGMAETLSPDAGAYTTRAATPADAAAGGTPSVISRVLEIWPKAIPRAPSIICAANPIRMKGNRTAGSAIKSVGMSWRDKPFRRGEKAIRLFITAQTP